MVTLIQRVLLVATDERSQTVLEKLDPERRAAVILALVGLGLLGVLLVVVALLAGRWARHERPSRSSRTPLRARLARDLEESVASPPPDEMNRGETIVDKPPDDTMAQ